jgi:hypothetical protein
MKKKEEEYNIYSTKKEERPRIFLILHTINAWMSLGIKIKNKTQGNENNSQRKLKVHMME